MKKIEKIGIFHIYQGDMGVMERLVKGGFLSEENVPERTDWEKEKEAHLIGKVYVTISDTSEFFKVSEAEEDKAREEGVKEGSVVKFETPEKQNGKSRWAYNIMPV